MAAVTEAGAHAHADGHHDADSDTLRDLPNIDVGGVRTASFAALVVGGVAFAVLTFLALQTPGGLRDALTGYTVGFVFWASLPLGAASLLMLAYLTSASWGIVLRRVFQASTRTLPVIGVLFCPIGASLYLAGGENATESPYWWSDKTWMAGSPEEVGKEKGTRPEAAKENQEKIHDYLNPRGFLIRTAAVLTVMGVLSHFLNKWGRRVEDHNDEQAYSNLRGLAGPGVLLWTIGMTVVSTDWVMSVEPVWASSMFPVIFGMNMFLTAFAFSIFVFYSLNLADAKVLSVVKSKFRIDMGTLTLGLTMVWAYASFSQYMLIWAGNLPEESIYYRKRGDHGWQYLAYFLMLFHWLAPFIILLFREVKTNPKVMRWVCVMLLTVCAADVIWWILPAVYRPEGVYHVPLALAGLTAVGGAWGLAFAYELGKRPVLPNNREGLFLAGWGHH